MAPPPGILIERKTLDEGTHISSFLHYNWGESTTTGTLWVEVEPGGSGTFSLTMDDSPNAMSWSHVCTPISSTTLETAGLYRGTVASTTIYGGKVRFKLNIGGTGSSATVAVYGQFKVR